MAMNVRGTSVTLSIMIALASAGVVHADDIRSGQWEVTTQTSSVEGSEPLSEDVSYMCFSDEEAVDLQKAFAALWERVECEEVATYREEGVISFDGRCDLGGEKAAVHEALRLQDSESFSSEFIAAYSDGYTYVSRIDYRWDAPECSQVEEGADETAEP